jgi:hypothetical protein
MRVRERVILSDVGPDPVAVLRELPEDYGFAVSGLSLISDRGYDPGFRQALSTHLRDRDLSPRIQHSVYPVFSPADFEAAPLLELVFPEIWVDEVDFSWKCSCCGVKRINIDYSRVVSRVPATRDVVDVNGQFVILSRAAVDSIQGSGLAGADFPPFDRRGEYFYLRPVVDLGSPIIRDDEVLDLRGACERCGFPRFKVFFGPLRFPSSGYHGQDFLWTSVFEDFLFSKKAYELLRSLDQDVEKDRPVYLE